MTQTITQRAHEVFRNCWDQPAYLLPLLAAGILTTLTTFATKSNPALSSKRSMPDISKPCRYRQDNSTSATHRLPDGRDLGYAQYGSPGGRAVFYHHGLPGSRIEAASFEEMALRMNARVIAVDRPGIGWSSPQPKRRILDHAKDIEQLAEHLGLDEYAVLGISGGGPYALACAASLPAEKLKAVAVVCGLGTHDMSKRGMNWFHWLGLSFGYRYSSWAVGQWIKREPAGRLDLSDEERLELVYKQHWESNPHEKDAKAFEDVDYLRLSMRTSRQAFAQGFEGFLLDGKLSCSDFGFRLEDIRSDLPVKLWYGRLDNNVPPVHGEETAARIGGQAQLILKDETHFSLFTEWRETILTDLVESF